MFWLESTPSGRTSGGWAPCRSRRGRSEEHTFELQSHVNLVCRLLLEKKKPENHGQNASSTSRKTSKDAAYARAASQAGTPRSRKKKSCECANSGGWRPVTSSTSGQSG